MRKHSEKGEVSERVGTKKAKLSKTAKHSRKVRFQVVRNKGKESEAFDNA